MKQVIVIRKDLNMRKGKMVAQGAHAAVMAAVRYYGHQDLDLWFFTGQTKICVSVDSEAELLEIQKKALAAGLKCELVTDAGRTEFNRVPTVTALAIGPDNDVMINAVTGHLKLL